MRILDFNLIKSMQISARTVYDWCNDVWLIKDASILPAKVKMWQGESGRYITMPCVLPSIDIAGVKFIARNVDDRNGVPARNSNIMIQHCSKMGLLAVCDGIWITNMRTGAIAAHSAITLAKRGAQTIGLMGLGIAAEAFFYFLGHMCKTSLTVKLLRYKDQAESFIERNSKYSQFKFEIVDDYDMICGCDIVVSAVGYARDCFAKEEVFQPGCLVIPIQTSGFQNCDLAFDKVIIDDYAHVASYRYYEQFKDKTVQMAEIVGKAKKGRDNDTQRIIAYCGGIALHDIYIAYKIYELAIERRLGSEITMASPTERFWI